MHPLINTWKTVGIINKDNVVNKVTRLTAAQSAAVILSCFDHLCTINLLALKGSLPVTHIRACPKAAHRPPVLVYKTYEFERTVLRLFSLSTFTLKPPQLTLAHLASIIFSLTCLALAHLLLFINYLHLKSIVESLTAST
jgi:hypothetical protein